MKIYDLAKTLENEMYVYPTDPPFLSYSFLEHDRNGCNVLKIEMGTHIGTHMDLPLHHIPDSIGADEIDLSRCFVELI